MERSTALRLLPPVHAQALTLSEEGLGGAELAQRLGIDARAVGPLLRIARSKLAALLAVEEPDDELGQRKSPDLGDDDGS